MNPEYAKMTRNDYVKEQVALETTKLLKEGGKVVDKVNAQGNVVESGQSKGLPYKTAKRIARNNVINKLGYIFGELGSSEVAGTVSRRERRNAARKTKESFLPMYNGGAPKSFKEAFGVGYERFNNKFVTVSK